MIKQIETTAPDGTLQHFEVITSKADLRKWLKDYWDNALWCNAHHEGIQESDALPEVWDDDAIAWRMHGKEYAYGEGEILPRRPNANNIDQLVSTNGYSTTIYNVDIVFDSDVDYWREEW